MQALNNMDRAMRELKSEAAANQALQQATEKNNGAWHREQAGSTWMQPSKTQRNTARAVKPLSTAEKVLRMLRSR